MIKDTFSLSDVPKEALYLGMAGVIPYVATSLETVYLSYEINRAASLGDGLIFSGQSAELMLHMLEPIQVGYGAVVSTIEIYSSIEDDLTMSWNRSFPSSVPSTGVLSGPDMVESSATSATLPVSSPPLSPGPL